MIIKYMKYGWCKMSFTIDNISSYGSCYRDATINASYITDVPDDLMDMCEDYLKKQSAICLFDEEGSTATLSLTTNNAFIIYDGAMLEVAKLEKSPLEIVKTIVDDLNTLFEDMCAFNNDIPTEEEGFLPEEIKELKQEACNCRKNYRERLDKLIKMCEVA